jgi:hypothetical protein
LRIEFKVENHSDSSTHPCASVYIEAEFEPESDEEYVSGGKKCTTEKHEEIPVTSYDKVESLSIVKTLDHLDGWGDGQKTYRFPHWSPTPKEKSESEDALDTDVTNKKFFYSQ